MQHRPTVEVSSKTLRNSRILIASLGIALSVTICLLLVRNEEEAELRRDCSQTFGVRLSSLDSPEASSVNQNMTSRRVMTPLKRLLAGPSALPPLDNDTLPRGEYGWKFLNYIPSDFERDWKATVRHVESLSNFNRIFPLFKARMLQLIKETSMFAYLGDAVPQATATEQCLVGGGGGRDDFAFDCRGNDLQLNSTIWSRMVYRFECLAEPCGEPPSNAPRVGDTHTSYIEPLLGMMRHPRNSLPDRGRYAYVQSKDYMIIDRWALRHLGTRWKKRPSSAKFFDLGASTYYDGGGGPSQSWFVDLAECMCVPMKEMWLWEAIPHDANVALNQVPGHLKPGYHWFNVPLSSDEDSWDNPLNHLLDRVDPIDGGPVFLKVDFDAPIVEDRIVELIRDVDAVSRRVDEFFFEHHVTLFWMSRLWGTYNKKMKSTDSIQLFQDLRSKGIRAHSWV